MNGPALDFVPAAAPGVETRVLDGDRLVWRGATLHRLDAMGSLVWECFDGETDIGDLGRLLAEEFGAAVSRVQSDVAALCAELLDEGLLDGGPAPASDPPPVIRPGQPPGAPLDRDMELPYATGRFVALHHDFGIRTDDARLASYFDRTLRSFAATGSPARWYTVLTSGEPGEQYRIYLDGDGLLAARDADLVARFLLWHVNHEVIHGSPAHLLVHAAGATIEGQAIVLPGQMNAGKTTLVGGLVLDGLGFLTDELVALNIATGLVDPYPRPLNIESGSWEALARLRPGDRDEEDPFPRLVWHVDATAIRPDAVAGSAPIGWIIAPRFEAGSPPRLQPLSRSEAAQMLHRHAFNKHQVASAGTRALVDAVGRARCARLVSGDLAAAVACVRRFVGGSRSLEGRVGP